MNKNGGGGVLLIMMMICLFIASHTLSLVEPAPQPNRFHSQVKHIIFVVDSYNKYMSVSGSFIQSGGMIVPVRV